MANTQQDVKIRLSAEGAANVVNALRSIQASANAASASAKNASSAMAGAAAPIAAVSSRVKSLAVAFAGLFVVDKVVGSLVSMAKAGIDANSKLEQTRLSLAAIIASQAKLADANNNALTGADKYAAALQLSDSFMQSLSGAAFQMGLNVKDVAAASAQILFTGLNNGVTDLSKLQQITISAAVGLRRLGIDASSLGDEVANMLRGQGNKITDMLGIPSEELERWKRQGTLIDDVTKRLNISKAETDAYSNSVEAMQSRADTAFSKVKNAFSKSFGTEIFKAFSGASNTAIEQLIDKTGKLAPALQNVVNLFSSIGTTVGSTIGSAIGYIANLLSSLYAGLSSNLTLTNSLSDSWSKLKTVFADSAKGLADIDKSLGLTVRSSALLAATITGATHLITEAQNAIAATFRLFSKNTDAIKYYDDLIARNRIYIAQLKEQSKEQLKIVTGATSANSLFGDQQNVQAPVPSFGLPFPTTLPPPPPPPPAPGKTKTAAGATTASGLATITGAENARIKADAQKADESALTAAIQALYVARNKITLDLVKAKNANEAAANKSAYDKGLLSLDEYTSKSLALLKSEQAAELALAEAKITAAESVAATKAADIKNKERAIAEAKAERDVLIQTQLLAVNALQLDALGTEKEKTLALREAKIKILELTNQQQLASAETLQLEIDKTDELLQKQGASLQLRAQMRDALISQSTGKAAQDETSRLFNNLDTKLGEVDALTKTGVLFPIEADLQKKQIITESITLLEQQVALMESSGMADAATETKKRITDLRISVDEYGQTVATLKQTLQDSLGTGLNAFFNGLIAGTSNVKTAFRSFALEIVSSIQKVAQQLFVNKILESFFTMGGGSSGIFSFLGSVVKRAGGGLVTGPGTGTSDSIPAALSNGEFVVKSSVVAQPGMLDYLRIINAGAAKPTSYSGRLKFADGGLVGSIPEASSQAKTDITVGLDDGLVLKAIKSTEGANAILDVITNKKRTIKNIIQ